MRSALRSTRSLPDASEPTEATNPFTIVYTRQPQAVSAGPLRVGLEVAVPDYCLDDQVYIARNGRPEVYCELYLCGVKGVRADSSTLASTDAAVFVKASPGLQKQLRDIESPKPVTEEVCELSFDHLRLDLTTTLLRKSKEVVRMQALYCLL